MHLARAFAPVVQALHSTRAFPRVAQALHRLGAFLLVVQALYPLPASAPVVSVMHLVRVILIACAMHPARALPLAVQALHPLRAIPSVTRFVCYKLSSFLLVTRFCASALRAASGECCLCFVLRIWRLLACPFGTYLGTQAQSQVFWPLT